MSSKLADPRLVVGVGASAGGLEAFKRLMTALPEDTGMAFLLVQHLDPTHKSLLAELLAPVTAMTVRNADQGVVLEPNTVYIIRPDTSLAVRKGKIELSEPTLHRGVRLPVDHLFRSLAHEYGCRSVGIVLSGAGSDGSGGIRDIKAVGGLTIAQNPETSGQVGMPQSAIDTGAVDLILEISQIPEALARFEKLPPQPQSDPPQSPEGTSSQRLIRLEEGDLGRLGALLEAQANFDIRVYKSATIERRVLRRMTLSGFEDIEPYFDYLRTDPREPQLLLRDLLISVTDFFRDGEAFEALRQMVIEPLVAQAAAGDPLRVWVPGCATGEEAYSIAMEFLDAIGAANKRLTLQVFATDLDQDALGFARAGVYPASIADRVSPQRLQAYFKPLDGKGYQVRSPLRDVISFAVHDLTKDPPFSRMDLVSCRNVLIYLTSEAQKHVLKVLHFALQPDGHLFLSTSETTGPQRDLFSMISKAQRIYRKVGASQPIAVAHSGSKHPPQHSRGEQPQAAEAPVHRPPPGGDLARRAALDAFAPPMVIVAESGAILFSHGDVEPYLRIPRGDNPRFELNAILRPEIATRARGALYKCRRDGGVVTAVSSPDGGSAQVRIQARPAPALGDGAVILAFERLGDEGGAQPQGREQPESAEHEAVVEQLEKELQATREDLRNTVEELETSNEELRSSNEESMSMNEELQSSNEELEATTEELRSLNEELTTVNAQLREKVDQLEQAHDDLHNFFASTKIATIFLDDKQCIKRFTPAARELLGVSHIDVGRCIGDIARDLLQNELAEEAKSVFEHLHPRTRDIHTHEGRWISRQVLPYRTESRRIHGVVVTFVDITELKSATERLALREHQQSVIARLGLRALRETDLDTFMDALVREVQHTLDTELCKVLELQPGGEQLLLRAGVGWKAGLVGSAHIDVGPNSQAGYTLRSSEPVIVDDLSEETRFSGPQLLIDHEVVSGLSCVIGDGASAYGVLGAHTRRPRAFSAEDANFLQAVASVLGSAIGRHQTRVRLAVEVGVATVLAEAHELDDTLAGVLECMAKELSCSVAEVWWAQDGPPLTRRQLRVGARTTRVEQHFTEPYFQPGKGLVGRAYQEGAALWCTDLGDPSLFVRREGAQLLGLVSGLGFPIFLNNEVVGVITLFSRQRLFADEAFLRTLEVIGRAIGDVIARSEFEQRARRLAAITASSHDAILSYELDGTVTEWLQGAERLFGYTADEMLGRSIECIVPENERQTLWAQNERVAAGEVLRPVDTKRLCKDGRHVAVSDLSSPIEGREGRIVGISSTDRDISMQKETERKLREADRQKDEFLAMLGHELRNPLAAIRNATEFLKLTGGDDPSLARTQAILERQSAHMAKLLDGLLDVSRIIRGKIRLEPRVVDLAAVCREVAKEVTERPSARELDIRTGIPPEPIWVEADPVRLTQIADNLMSNAVKYTPNGGCITLALTRNEGAAWLKVRDTGVGIDPELLPDIFDVFRQSTQNLDRAHGGLGIGLALVKSLVEMHDGSIEARSEGKGRGAEFLVRLPTTDKRKAKTPRRAHGDLAMTILLLEDNEDSAEMLAEVLELSGHRVTHAARAQQGIDLAREHEFDVVLCDIGLPDGMSGYDVARVLRAESDTRRLPLIALTGYGRPEDEARCEEAGFDAHVTKPVDAARIARVLEDVRRGGLTMRSGRS